MKMGRQKFVVTYKCQTDRAGLCIFKAVLKIVIIKQEASKFVNLEIDM